MDNRMKVWEALKEPKMTWETFKRMLPVFDGDADKALLHWRGMMSREVWGDQSGRVDADGMKR